MATIYRLGDGQQMCSKHRTREFPDMEDPTTGWREGECDICKAESVAARSRGRAKSPRKTASSRVNGAKGGRPRSPMQTMREQDSTPGVDG